MQNAQNNDNEFIFGFAVVLALRIPITAAVHSAHTRYAHKSHTV